MTSVRLPLVLFLLHFLFCSLNDNDNGNDNDDMIFIPAGTFMMGSEDGQDNEKPRHTVSLDAFYMDKYKVTNLQFCQFLNQKGNQEEGGSNWLDIGSKYCQITMKENRFVPKDGFEKHPVVMMSWYGARAYAEWVGKRLPTEAEWEYAARGGKQFEYGTSTGSINPDLANYVDSQIGESTPVGQYPANPYGLYDMAGNVWDWCSDWYQKDYYRNSPEKNPTGPASGTFRVCRGGSWSNSETVMRTAYRSNVHPRSHNFDVGFRCAR